MSNTTDTTPGAGGIKRIEVNPVARRWWIEFNQSLHGQGQNQTT